MFFQIVALLLSIIIVHTIYVTVIRPNAENIIKKHTEMAAAGEQYEVPRSFFVVITDLEQEPRLAVAALAAVCRHHVRGRQL